MKSFGMLLLCSLMSITTLCFANEDESMNKPQTNPTVLFKTTAGDIKVELYPEKAPITVKNFLQYVEDGHYNQTIFHRVIPGFMVQGGGFSKEMKEKSGRAPIKNEADNGLLNERGTLAMARTSVVDSASAQFFINVANNGFLNFRDKTPSGYGYAVFGKVIEGMDIVDKIVQAPSGNHGPHENVPVTAIEILDAKVLTK
jgi:cyclophilin family peptidyl-prolyl cis-trans isomerase